MAAVAADDPVALGVTVAFVPPAEAAAPHDASTTTPQVANNHGESRRDRLEADSFREDGSARMIRSVTPDHCGEPEES
ncbi:MAG: hypothetical protein ACXWBO_00805 [Ilumatobacteraceae bacterium]